MRDPQRYGPWALVTGASDGIGKALAQQIAANGINIVLVARTEDRLRAVATELKAAYGIETMVLAADLADPDALERVEALTSPLDVGLVVLAAGFGITGTFLVTSLPDEMALIGVNISAVTRLSHTFARPARRLGAEAESSCSDPSSAGRGYRDRPITRHPRPTCRASRRHCTTSSRRTESTCSRSHPDRSRPASAPGPGWR